MNTIPLDVMDVARPCPVDWNEMRGDERVRFCRHCSLHVYNLSEMSRAQAERLVSETEGRLCVRFYRRADGTITTRDCGIKAAAKRLGRWASAATAVALSTLIAALGLNRISHASATPKCDNPAATPLMGKIRPPTSQPSMIMGEAVAVMGSVAPITLPPPPATPPATQPATQPAVTSE
jgi:hypothetical protein